MVTERVLAIALPDSLLVDEDNLRGKTLKVGQIARSASIFGVQRIYIYRDSRQNFERDYQIAREILQYAETPQYLRKRLIAKKNDLENVGLLPPLRIPHHKLESKLAEGEIREAVLFFLGGKLLADVGAREAAEYSGRGQANQRVTVRVDSTKTPLRVSESKPPENTFWGYEVRRAPSLARFLRSLSFDLIVLTSRNGNLVNKRWIELVQKVNSATRTIVCFGAPDIGIDKLLKQDQASVSDFSDAEYLNMFPAQQVATVRLEEALLGSLTLVNLAKHTNAH
jgi:predicted SPOUT superfamily RNA methylase MTH1